MGKGKKNTSSEAADPARSVGRLVGLCVGVAVGLAAATCGLVAGVPAPDLLVRALIAGVAFRLIAGWCGSALARSVLSRPQPAPGATRPEGDR